MSTDEKSLNESQSVPQSIFLVINAFVWLFFSLDMLFYNNDVMTNNFNVSLLWGIYFGFLIISLIIGGRLTNKIGSRNLFVIWTLLGIVSPVGLLFLNNASLPVISLVFVVLAISAGLGMPNCMEHFVNSTRTSKRGLYAGFIFLFSVLGLFLFRIIGGGVELAVFILVVWRLSGLFAIFRKNSFESPENRTKANISYRSVVTQRSFLLYLVPWIMFSVVNYVCFPVEVHSLGISMANELQLIENIIGPICSIPAGLLIDHFGRKQAAVAGFVLVGLSYSLLGLFPAAIGSWYFYTVFDGISWGVLSVLFVVCIWGELNQDAQSGKYYAIGVLPFFVSEFLTNVLSGDITSGINASTLFSFTAFFLFLAVLPLLHAPETLPEKVMKDRDLKSYVEKAMKKAKSETEKNQTADTSNKNSEEELQVYLPNDNGSPENDEEYEKAKKLAEKYY